MLPGPLLQGDYALGEGTLGDRIALPGVIRMKHKPREADPQKADGATSSRRLLVLSHRSLYAEGIAELLRRQCCLEVTQATASLRTAPKRVQQVKPDILLVDSLDVGLNPDALIPVLTQEMPDLQIICLALGDECPRACPARIERVNTKGKLLAALGECARSSTDQALACAGDRERSEHAGVSEVQ